MTHFGEMGHILKIAQWADEFSTDALEKCL